MQTEIKMMNPTKSLCRKILTIGFLKKRTILLFLFYFLYLSLSSQNWRRINELSDEALLAFYEYRFSESARLYEEILQLLPNSNNFAYLAAIAYFASTENIQRTIELLEIAAKNIAPTGTYNYSSVKELRAPADALYFLGRSYMVQEQYEKAEQALNSFIEKNFEDDELIPLARQQLKNISVLKNKIDISPQIKFENIKELNNDKPNLFPVISGDKSTVAFTVPLEDGLNVFVSSFSNGKWSAPRNITWDIAGGVYRTAFLSYNGKELYLINENPPQQIVYSEFIDGGWNPVKKLKKPINGRYAQSSVALTKNGRTMYFTSNRPGGFGGFDIYVATLNEKGKWSLPSNLGNIVNTEFNEEFVMLSPDEQLLFFSSEGHENYGGSDIFVWEIGSVNAPQNIGFPLNNGYNNNFFYPLGEKSGLISLVRPEGFGNFDIYSVTIQENYPVIAKISYSPTVNALEKIILEVLNSQNEKLLFLDPMEIKPTLQLGYFSPGSYKINILGNAIENSSTAFEIKKQLSIETVFVQVEIVAKPQQVVAQVIPETISATVTKSPAEPERESKEPQPTPKPVQKFPESPVIAKQPTASTPKVETTSKKREPKKQPQRVKEFSTPIVEKLSQLPQKGQFTIQIMALEIPLTINETLKMGDINIFYSAAGYYLYTTGFYETINEAELYLNKIREQFPKAFVRKVPESEYVIQLMALKNPKDLFEVGQKIDDVSMIKGNDDFYRYFVGGFKTRKEAEIVLPNIRSNGFPEAWVRKMPTP